MLKKLILVMTFTFGSIQAHAQGLNLNDALLGCILSGGACLGHTGITLIDELFGNGNYKVAHYTHADVCRDFVCNWHSHGNGGMPGYNQCRHVKQAYYKEQRIKKGDWPKSFGQKRNSYHENTEQDYFEMLENEWLPWRGGKPYFDCTVKQRLIFIKARCGERHSTMAHWGIWGDGAYVDGDGKGKQHVYRAACDPRGGSI